MNLLPKYNPRSNGLAESGVKIVKDMLHKCMGESKDIQRVLYEFSTSGGICRSSTATLLLSSCLARASSCCFPSRLVHFSLWTIVMLLPSWTRNFSPLFLTMIETRCSCPLSLQGKLFSFSVRSQRSGKNKGERPVLPCGYRREVSC